MKTIPVIIPYFCAEEELQKCLSALEDQSYKPIDIFVRDNSIDNILFIAAINEGLQKYSSNKDIDYILILNQDAYVQKETIRFLVKSMEADENCGIACPIQISSKDNSIYWGGGFEAFPFGRHQGGSLSEYSKDFDTYWANGACMLLRVKMIREIGFFDKNMKFICSDSDYSYTARSRGWKVKVAHQAHVYHSAGACGSVENSFINTIKNQDAIYFAKKWLNGDLYKSLSYDGEKLTRMKIQTLIQNLESAARNNV
ncbi:glycosyltransferase family 2 protein [Polynucleobacter sp. MG-Unter2-18]|uniref:glycosyltransferase n=1 Tax=Polynucleobacter sp. MG-Unter2-18 TaxID=2081052 RepID=UPI001BFD92A4|nr:glycosyltransferase family 2 protein [Polynucleobacter sp. MG-Unter2-18]QWD94693.1 glycosyltransferase family 2 protein [Polynucleobacter sp. MG-Unter2-18]